MEQAASESSHISVGRKLLIAAIALSLLGIAWLAYTANRTTESPSQSTTETRPNSAQNTPPGSEGSVTQDSNESTDTVPSSSGTGANNYLSQEQNATGQQ